jgi:cytoskeletal protein CcmA (bactofilin family)
MMGNKDKRLISTFLGPEARIEGTIHFDNTIRLDGHVKGVVKSGSGTVIVGKTAVIEAEIHVGTAIIMGRVRGAVTAGNKIEIYAPAEVTGDIRAPVISMEKGVRFNGNCGINGPAAQADSGGIQKSSAQIPGDTHDTP